VVAKNELTFVPIAASVEMGSLPTFAAADLSGGTADRTVIRMFSCNDRSRGHCWLGLFEDVTAKS